jgi:hypothetical protein
MNPKLIGLLVAGTLVGAAAIATPIFSKHNSMAGFLDENLPFQTEEASNNSSDVAQDENLPSQPETTSNSSSDVAQDENFPSQPETTSDSSSDVAQATGSQPDLVLGQVIIQETMADDTSPLTVQWNVTNSGQGASQGFKDQLQVFFVGKESNACPGQTPPTGNPVYESEGLQEEPLSAGQTGQLMVANVSPLPEGSYLFYVTANSDHSEPNESDFSNNSNFNCIHINHS